MGVTVDPISIEELALLDVLERIDHRLDLGANSANLCERLVESGLVVSIDGELGLTDAGVERCKSLHHRVAADEEAALILLERDKQDDPDVATA